MAGIAAFLVHGLHGTRAHAHVAVHEKRFAVNQQTQVSVHDDLALVRRHLFQRPFHGTYPGVLRVEEFHAHDIAAHGQFVGREREDCLS